MDNRQAIAIVGLFATILAAAYMVIRLEAQAQTVGDYTNAATAEVRDAQGQVVLRGQFMVVEEEDDDIERKAALGSTGVHTAAVGEAEVEISKAAPAVQEVEFSVRNLPAGGTVTFVIDGQDVASATIDRRGAAAVELEVRMP